MKPNFTNLKCFKIKRSAILKSKASRNFYKKRKIFQKLFQCYATHPKGNIDRRQYCRHSSHNDPHLTMFRNCPMGKFNIALKHTKRLRRILRIESQILI
jgi:hypothetical protein